jgi:tetratricopeptide (TPR) repeat protein
LFDGVETFKLAESGSPEEALKICNDRLTENPDDSLAMFIAAYSLSKASKWGMAYNLLLRAAQLSPNRHEIHNNLGNCCINMLRDVEAEKHIKRALALSPQSRPGLNNMALLKVYDCKPEEALHFALQSLKQDPDQWDVSETYGYAQMMLGNWEEGWKGYEKMVGFSKARPWKPFNNEPRWDGTKGVKVHIRGEQGIGDEISFASILPDAKKDIDIMFECDHKLVGLFKRSFPEIEIHGTRFEGSRDWSKDSGAHYFSLLGSLARYYRNKKEDFPGTPYLVADDERRLQWRVLLDRLPGKKIGIAWTGGLKNTFKDRRSISLETMLPLLKIPGITWVSLQYKDCSDEIEEFEKNHGIKIHHWKRGSESRDYDDVAALVMELDSVVSVTTAVIHLCGALGKECHIMVPSRPRWFYGLKGERSLWYNSVTLHRQKGKDWNSVMASVKRAITTPTPLEAQETLSVSETLPQATKQQ